MFKWATFREIWDKYVGEVFLNGRSMSRNVAHLKILVHDVINVSYKQLCHIFFFFFKSYCIEEQILMHEGN